MIIAICDWGYLEHLTHLSLSDLELLDVVLEAIERRDSRIKDWPMHLREFFFEMHTFSQILNEVAEQHLGSISDFVRFGGPIMLFAPQFVAPVRDLDLPDYYAVLSPETVVELLDAYGEVDFNSLEHLYNAALHKVPGYYEGDVTFPHFLKYCQAWAEILSIAVAEKKGIICGI